MVNLWSRVIGVGLLLVAVYFGLESLEFRRDGIVVDGTVVGFATETDPDDDESSRAVIAYTPIDSDESLELQANWTESLFYSHREGDTIAVRYLPAFPQRARIDSMLFDAGGPLLLFLLGGLGVLGLLKSGDDD